MESDDEDTPEQLRELIARSDAIIAGAGRDPEDPEVQLAVAVAHLARARALGQLRRYRECLEDCDRFLTGWSELFPNPNGRQRLRLLVVLGIKRDALRFVGRRNESLLLGTEITERFGDDTDPMVRTLVALGMVRRAETLLAQPDGVAEALAVSDELVARFDDEPAENLEGFAQLLLMHARNLLVLYTSAPGLMLGLSAETVINTGAVAAQSALALLDSAVTIPRLEDLAGTAAKLTPRAMVRHRRRVAQAIVVAAAVRRRFADYDEPDIRALDAQARILTAAATIVSGHPVAGGKTFDAFEGSGDAGAVQAFSALADSEAQSRNWLSQIGTLSLLYYRAMALVGEDPELARLAYDDSVTARLPAELSPVVKVFVKILRPSLRHAGRDQDGAGVGARGRVVRLARRVRPDRHPAR